MPATFHMHPTKRGERLYVRIFSPHDQTVVSDRLATDADKARFPVEWAAFEESLKPKAEPAGKKRSARKKAG